MKSFKIRSNFDKVIPKYPHLTEFNALKAGESAFKLWVPIYNNPYLTNPLKSAWIRGYKRSERLFNEARKRSFEIQESLGFEEVGA